MKHDHWMTTGLIGASGTFQRVARDYAEEYAEQVAEPLLARIAAQRDELVALTKDNERLQRQIAEPEAQLASGQEPVNEREAFEAWAIRCNPRPDDYRLLRTPHANKPYAREWVRAAWEAWQFRATHGIMEQQ